MEQFSRLLPMFSAKDIEKLNKSCVAIIGLGGVGGSVCLSLARCGVANFILCDFDTIEESNINRQVIALHSNIGAYKTDEAEICILDINPNAKVTKLTKKVDEELFKYNVDIVIDCIDDIKSKIYLINECLNRDIKVLSSMGAGNKMDPSKVEITKLSKTTYDPIAKILRQEFKGKDFLVCSSTEEAKKSEVVSSYINVVSVFSLLLADKTIKLLLGE